MFLTLFNVLQQKARKAVKIKSFEGGASADTLFDLASLYHCHYATKILITFAKNVGLDKP